MCSAECATDLAGNGEIGDGAMERWGDGSGDSYQTSSSNNPA